MIRYIYNLKLKSRIHTRPAKMIAELAQNIIEKYNLNSAEYEYLLCIRRKNGIPEKENQGNCSDVLSLLSMDLHAGECIDLIVEGDESIAAYLRQLGDEVYSALQSDFEGKCS